MARPRTPVEVIEKVKELVQFHSLDKVAKIVGLPKTTVYQYTRESRPSRAKKKKERQLNTEFFDWKDYNNSII